MKRLPLTILLCGLIAVPLSSAFPQDPVKLSPQFYKVLIDNDEIRVLEFHFKPGEKEPMHSHPRGFVYALTDAKLKVSLPDGNSEEIVIKAGEAHWREPVTHAIENIGTGEARAIAVELKTPEK
jgi:quercetin dioxygenase-like cupin family protein